MLGPHSADEQASTSGRISRAGRARYEAIDAGARDILTGEEVSTTVGFVGGAWWILSQRGKAAAAGRAYQRPTDER